jgi:threonine/homoserine/homoserine lactone efflux protein
MPDAAHLTAFAVAAITIAVIPGPGMLYVLARSLGGGRSVGMRSSVGTGIGGLVHVAAAAAGLSALIAASATAFTIVKYLGAAYLIWLGLRALLARDHAPSLGSATINSEGALRQGVLTEVLNPKTALFFLTFLPQFCQPENGPLAVQMIVLGTISVALNTLADVVVAHGAGRISEWLRTRPKAWRRQQVATGGILVGLGVYAAAAGHRAK